MGVPAFFRWLTRKYPSIVVDCFEEIQYDTSTGEVVPQDTSQPNKNQIEFDNLYLDMNGIIHPCTHPEDKPAPKNEDEMMIAIFECIDRIFAIVRPRKLLFMAIDGVAPRAKMNQQRSRRFRAIKETYEKTAEIARIRKDLIDRGMKLLPEKPKGEHFDSNCITPGTPFMDRLSKCLHYYIHDKINTDPGWAGIKVILSDANVPGEGEHKIMEYIRKQRAQPDHDPNTHHVLCGADADLIMLGLATHEVNFTIIREEFRPNKDRPCDICGKSGHEYTECEGLEEEMEKPDKMVYEQVNFIFVRLNVLREYLERELEMPDISFEYDFERALDDWVFMCFFVGNDFLPHLPSLEIRENAIDKLIRLYKKCCIQTGGYLTLAGKVNMKRVQLIMEELGKMEDAIFEQRRSRDLQFRNRDRMFNKRRKGMEMESANQFKNRAGLGSLGLMKAGETAFAHNAHAGIQQQLQQNMGMRGVKRSHDDVEDEDAEPPDEVRLYEQGFKDRYYESKFEVPKDNVAFRQLVANEYAVGLCWVLRYYYQGCSSWKWYFPYHYAPFASDFGKCGDITVDFDLGEPFKPLEQLMGVFPAGSRSHVPLPWGELMIDPLSNIIDFYPEDFKIDLNGKKFAWQGVALLPFVDETRLKQALGHVYHLLTEDENRRNITGLSQLYIGSKHEGHRQLVDIYRMGIETDFEVQLNSSQFQGMGGIVLLSNNVVKQKGEIVSPVSGLDGVQNNKVVCVRYLEPKYETGFIFPAIRLPNATAPERVLKQADLNESDREYRPRIGFNRNMPRASLDQSGHRKVNFGAGVYSNMAPPPNVYQSNRFQRGHTNNWGGRGGTPERTGGFRGGSQQFGGSRGNLQQFGGSQGNLQQFGGSRGNSQQFGGSRGNSQQFGGSRGNSQQFGGSRGNSQQFGGSRGNSQQFGGSRGNSQQFEGSRGNSQQHRGFRGGSHFRGFQGTE